MAKAAIILCQEGLSQAKPPAISYDTSRGEIRRLSGWEGDMRMIQPAMQFRVRFFTVLVLTMTILLPLESVFGSGIARRDAVRSEEQHRQEAVQLAKEAADHGKQGDVGLLLSSAEAALQHAFKAGKDSRVDAGITELKQALEQGSAGHGDVAIQHAEHAVIHLSGK